MNTNQSTEKASNQPTMALYNLATGTKIGSIALQNKTVQNNAGQTKTLHGFHLVDGRSKIYKDWLEQKPMVAIKASASNRGSLLKGRLVNIVAYPAKKGQQGLIEFLPEDVMVEMPAKTVQLDQPKGFWGKLSNIWGRSRSK